MAFMKLDDESNPGSIDRSRNPKRLANEDRFQEFHNIDLGHWASLDLKAKRGDKSKTESGSKYPWASALVVHVGCFETDVRM